jgi:Protein of unknown function (DUF1826)
MDPHVSCLEHERPGEPRSSVRVVDHVTELTAIYAPEVNVVALRRPPSPELLADGDRAVREPSFRTLFVIRPGSKPGDARGSLEAFPHLAGDAQRWAEVLADLTGAEQIGVRVIRVTAAMCPRFHVDRVTLRVVRTYRGPGTEYVASEHVDRRRLGHSAGGLADEHSGLLRSPSRIHRAEPGDVVLLKGEAWPENAGRGAVHRSPSASEETPRLVMTLDLL